MGRGYAMIHDVGDPVAGGDGLTTVDVVAVPPWPCRASKVLTLRWRVDSLVGTPRKGSIWHFSIRDGAANEARAVEDAAEVIAARREPADADPIGGFPWRKDGA